MARVKVKIVSLKSLSNKLRRIPLAQTRGVARAIVLSALEVEGNAERNISRGSRSGRVNPATAGRRSQPHQASAPGEFPKSDTGALVASITHVIDADGLGASVGTNIAYGPHLEFGTTKMAARPWLKPTFDAAKERIRLRILRAAERANRQAAGR